MSEFKGTKGPWVWDDEGLGNKTMLVFGKDYPVDMTSKENKSLIAAAPDLLAAIIEITKEMDAIAWQMYLDPIIERANKAIAKALGETK